MLRHPSHWAGVLRRLLPSHTCVSKRVALGASRGRAPKTPMQKCLLEFLSVQVEPVGTAVADVLLQCDPETFVLLMLGRLPLSEALAQRRLVAEGAREQISAFAQWFQGA